jgi:predicted RNA-binding protein
VNVYFPHDVVVEDVVAIEAPLGGQCIQCLIGRDVLRNGLLVYVGHANQFTLAF